MHHKPPLIEGPSAEVVIADTAYDADHLRQAITAKEALAVIVNNASLALRVRLTNISLASPSRRMLLLRTQTVSPGRHPLRKTARDFRAVVTLTAIILWMR